MFRKLKYTFIGRPLKSLTDGEGDYLENEAPCNVIQWCPVFYCLWTWTSHSRFSQALSPLAIWWSLPIGTFCPLILASLTISYRQIIHAYPQGGGAYMVTRENLLPWTRFDLQVASCWLYADSSRIRCVWSWCYYSSHPALHPYNLHIFYFPSLSAHALEFKRFERICQLSDDSCLPLYLQYSLSLALWVLSNYLQVPLNYQATSTIGSNCSWAFPLFSHWEPLPAVASWQGLRLFQMRYHFSKLRKKRMLLRPWPSCRWFWVFLGITFLNYWISITPQNGETILSQMARAFLVIHSLVMLATISFPVLNSLDSSCSCNTGSALPMLAYNMAKNSTCPHLFYGKGDRLAIQRYLILALLGPWSFFSHF